MASKILKIGHRGAKGYEPENTIASFQKAIDMGVDAIEFDVRICRTGQLVVNHDWRVDRTTDGHGYVADLSLPELKKLKVAKSQSVLTLEEALDFVNRRAQVNIEIKSIGAALMVVNTIEKYVHPVRSSSEVSQYRESKGEAPLESSHNRSQLFASLEEETTATFQRGEAAFVALTNLKEGDLHQTSNGVKEKGWSYDDFLVSSFNHYELQGVRRLNPKIKIGVLILCVPIDLAKFAEDLGAYSLHLHIEFATQELIDDAHRRGIKVFIWGIDCKEDVERITKMGVDGIFCDFPDWVNP